jgi:hypothetical protein
MALTRTCSLIQKINYEYDASLWYSAYIQAFLELKKQNTIYGKVDYAQLNKMTFNEIKISFIALYDIMKGSR